MEVTPTEIHRAGVRAGDRRKLVTSSSDPSSLIYIINNYYIIFELQNI